MGVRDRIRKYRAQGGAADLVRVEVLVPASKREEVIGLASRLRAEHRARTARLSEMCDEALSRYRSRILDNIDLERLADVRQRAAVVAKALMERGDARAFALGRRLLDEARL